MTSPSNPFRIHSPSIGLPNRIRLIVPRVPDSDGHQIVPRSQCFPSLARFELVEEMEEKERMSTNAQIVTNSTLEQCFCYGGQSERTRRAGIFRMRGTMQYSNPDVAYSLGAKSYLLRRTMGEVEVAPPDVRTTIIDPHHHRAAVLGIGDSHARTDRKRLRRGCQFVGIESLTVTGYVAHESRAVPRCDFKLAPRRRNALRWPRQSVLSLRSTLRRASEHRDGNCKAYRECYPWAEGPRANAKTFRQIFPRRRQHGSCFLLSFAFSEPSSLRR